MKAKLVAASLLTLLPALASAEEWTIDPTHSSVSFSIRHMMVTDVHGRFDAFKGTVNLDPKDVTKSTVEAEIEVASVSTNNAKRDEHLRSPDFFNVKDFPKMTFRSTKVTKAGKGLKIEGDLTLHGVTKKVTLDVTGPSAPMKNPWGVQVRALSATTQIEREAFGLGWNKPIEAGGVLVGKTVTIRLDLELNPKAANAS